MKWYRATCPVCGKEFAGRRAVPPKYCSRSCNGKANAKHLPKEPSSLSELMEQMIKGMK